MNHRTEGLLAIGAAILSLFTALVDPMISFIIATGALTLLGSYQFIKK